MLTLQNKPENNVDFWRFSVAPMLGWTNRACRQIHRLLTKETKLYTEMVPAQAILAGSADRYLLTPQEGSRIALQLGGNCPMLLAQAAAKAEQYGYSEVNLNVGCPSSRVQAGMFGAILMKSPLKVAACVKAMQDASSLPISVKCRIGVDTEDNEAFLNEFVHLVSTVGECRYFIVHARKAWLKGLNPSQNRSVPPLEYERVMRLKAEFPHLKIVLNGGIQDLTSAEQLINALKVDGVMMGRAAYQQPWLLSKVDTILFKSKQDPFENRNDFLHAVAQLLTNTPGSSSAWWSVTRHLLGIFHNYAGSRAWKQALPCIDEANTLLDLALKIEDLSKSEKNLQK